MYNKQQQWLYRPVMTPRGLTDSMDLLYTVNLLQTSHTYSTFTTKTTKTNEKLQEKNMIKVFTGIWVQGSVVVNILSSANATTAWIKRDTEWERVGGTLAHRSRDRAFRWRLFSYLLPELINDFAWGGSVHFFSHVEGREAADNPVPVNFLPVWATLSLVIS